MAAYVKYPNASCLHDLNHIVAKSTKLSLRFEDVFHARVVQGNVYTLADLNLK